MRPRTLYVDGMCMFHRAASGFTAGEHFVTFNFFRSLRAIVEQLRPTRIVIALEGTPVKRLNVDPGYKANRRVPPETDADEARIRSFFGQVEESVQLLREHFPVSVVRHPELEADDVIARLVRRSSRAILSTIVSTDRDYLQLVAEAAGDVELYDPVKKCIVDVPASVGNFVVWKSLRGDGADCIPRIVPDKLAEQASSDTSILREVLEDPDAFERFRSNVELVQFAEPCDGEDGWHSLESSQPRRDWDAVGLAFTMLGFKSIMSGWARFVATFDPLFS
jgi:hypothetical protein